MFNTVTMDDSRILLNDLFKNEYPRNVGVSASSGNAASIEISFKNDETDKALVEAGSGWNMTFQNNSTHKIYVKGTSGDVLSYYAY